MTYLQAPCRYLFFSLCSKAVVLQIFELYKADQALKLLFDAVLIFFSPWLYFSVSGK